MSGLPDRPDLDQLRRQARELLRAALRGERHAAERLGAVSPLITLSAAQLALAREYGFQSWAALKAEVARCRSGEPADRWSFGGVTTLQTPAGILLPEILIAGASQAILYGSLTLSQNRLPAATALPRRALAPDAQFAGARGKARDRHAEARAHGARLRALTSVSVVDDHGARYAFTDGGASGQSGAPETFVRLRVDPVPRREARWIELLARDGATARLLPSPRAGARVGQLMPACPAPARLSGGRSGTLRADGPQLHRDIGVALPAINGVSIHLDSLISLPGSWELYLRAWPGWRNHSLAGEREHAPVSVLAEDDRGGSYLGSYARGISGNEELAGKHMEREDLALRFLPRLDPLACALKLTLQGTHEEITVDLDIADDLSTKG